MLSITFADLRHRSRQLVIAVVGAGLVFAMALLMTGLADSFQREIERTVDGVGADAWVMPTGAAGPFTGFSALPETAVAQVSGLPGVRRAEPLVVIPGNAVVHGALRPSRLIGHVPGGLGTPTPFEGRTAAREGEAVVDTRVGVPLGGSFTAGGRPLLVVGTVRGQSMLGGIPSIFVTTREAQLSAFGGQPLVTAIVTDGVPTTVPAGLAAVGNREVERVSRRAIQDAITSIGAARSLMWVVAALIVAALVYVSTLQRAGDLSVLKAVGSSTSALAAGVALQAVVVAVAAAAFAAVAADRLRPLFPLPIEISARAYLLLPVAALLVGLAASLAGIRQVATADPAEAFG